MRTLFNDVVLGGVFSGVATGMGWLVRTAILQLTDIPEPFVTLTIMLVFLASSVPLGAALLSTDPSPDRLFRFLLLPPGLFAAFCPLLIERAHSALMLGFWQAPLPFQTLPLYGQPILLVAIAAGLAALPYWRFRAIDR